MTTPSPLYEVEIRDLLKVIDSLDKTMSGPLPLASLYVDTLEATLMHDGGDVIVFRLWWDSESACFRVERPTDAGD